MAEDSYSYSGSEGRRSKRPKSEVYQYYTAGRVMPAPVEREHGMCEDLMDVLRKDEIQHPHLFCPASKSERKARIKDISKRQLNGQSLMIDSFGERSLKAVCKYYDMEPLDVDGMGFCSFNAVFASLWFAGCETFENGEELFMGFCDYIVTNHKRLERQYVEIEALGANQWLNPIATGDDDAERQTQFMILAEFLNVNIMVFSNTSVRFVRAMYSPGENHLQVPTIAIYNFAREHVSHFVALVPKSNVVPETRFRLEEKLQRAIDKPGRGCPIS